MKLYRKLDINGKINLKHLCVCITGIEFYALCRLFSYKECFILLESKLRAEGFDI